MSEADSTSIKRRPVRTYPGVAWIVIVVVAAGIAVRQAGRTERAPRRGVRRLERAAAEIQGKYFLGVAELPFINRTQLIGELESVNAGPPRARFRFVTLVGELASADAALKRLTAYDEALLARREELSADERALENVLRRLYRDYAADRLDAPSLDRGDRRLLVKQLGWYGRLALHPADGPHSRARQALLASAHRTMLAVLGGLAALSLAGLLGLAALIVFTALFLAGKLQRPLSVSTGHGGVYAETFAVWLLLFWCLAWLPAVCAAIGLWRPTNQGNLLLQGALMLFSLAALLWPVWRGVPWPQVRQDIGWTLGRGPLVEALLGGATYVAAIPLLAVGLIAVFVLLTIERSLPGAAGPEALDPTALPSHPIVEWVTRGKPWKAIQVFLLASFIAPLVEETMFRGVLYRHLRDATGGRMTFGLSVLLSGAATSFVFAAIHPQGWVAIPALMSLAFAFALAREWRGTLVPAVLAHGLNNGLLTWVLITLAG